MCRSSILNFESLEGVTLRVPGTLLAVIAVIGGMELAFRLFPEEKLLPKLSRQGEIVFMEKEVIPKFDSPKIVLLGSSRMRRAIVPARLDELLGQKKGSTINLGLAMARPFDSLYMYERNEAALGHAQFVILNLDEWHLSSGPKISNSLYEIQGPLFERWGFPDRLRTRLLLDGIFTMRLKLKLVPGAIFGRKAAAQTLKLDENNQVLPPTGERALESYDDWIATFYSRFDTSSVLLSHIERLANKVMANGGTFVLLQLPNRAAYQAEVERTHGKDFQSERAALEALAVKLDVPLWFYRLPQEVGLKDEDYHDYGHLKPQGALIVTDFLAQKILELKRGSRTTPR